MVDESSRCGVCGNAALDESDGQRVPCPTCGSLKRAYRLSLSDSVDIHESLKGKVVDPKKTGKKKVRAEFVSGDDLHRKTGQWNKLERDIDRESDRYREKIVDSETGQIIRSVDEPLSQHQGRGSARRPAK
jgi:gluconate kinase